jgi:hypothetical protein
LVVYRDGALFEPVGSEPSTRRPHRAVRGPRKIIYSARRSSSPLLDSLSYWNVWKKLTWCPGEDLNGRISH